MIYNAARFRRLSSKLQVDIYKTKKDKSVTCAVVHPVVEIQSHDL